MTLVFDLEWILATRDGKFVIDGGWYCCDLNMYIQILMVLLRTCVVELNAECQMLNADYCLLIDLDVNFLTYTA